MAFQKQLIFFDGAIGRGSTDDENADVMIAQVPGGASGLSIGLARVTRLYGQVKTEDFNNLTNIRFRAWLRNADGTVNEQISEVTPLLSHLQTSDRPFWNIPIPVVDELRTADRIRVDYEIRGINPTEGEVFIGLIIGGAGVEPKVKPGAVTWGQTGLRATESTQIG